MAAALPKIIQIETAQWVGHNGVTYTLYALDDAGQVWRFSPRDNDWVAHGPVVAEFEKHTRTEITRRKVRGR